MRLSLILGIVYILLMTSMSYAKDASNSIDIYQNTHAGMFSPLVKNALYRAYVPNGESGTVSVIDPLNYKVVDTFSTGRDPQHVVPAYDLQTLWVLNNKSNSLTPINPLTAKPGPNVRVDDPYNLYFTQDGKFAIVVCEGRKQLEFHDPKTMKLISKLNTNCSGANHMDFSVDGKFAIVTCEYSGQLMKVDLENNKVLGYLSLNIKKPMQPDPVKQQKIAKKDPVITITSDGHVLIENDSIKNMSSAMTSMPQDIRSTPNGNLFFVADMLRDGVVLIDPFKFIEVGFIPTGIGTHAIYPSRDGKLFYVSNRGCHHMSHCPPHGEGNISVIDPFKRILVANWSIPNGGSPDMGNVTADGKELWLSGRYDSEVYVFDTNTGNLTHRIPVGRGPHGLTVWPQPGRYSLGHTGNMR